MRDADLSTKTHDEMIKESKKLLEYMGIPSIQALSEGEAQCAFMCKNGTVDFAGSQDFDSLLFGSPYLVKNLSITGKRKLPRKEVYIEIKPEIIELETTLSELGISHKQLIAIGILIGTDYSEGIKGVGPKTALKLIKEHENLGEVLKKVDWESDVKAEDIFDFFLNPPVTNDYKIEWNEPNKEKIIDFMVGDHDFSTERIEKVIEKLQQSFTAGRQASLKGWFK